MGKPLGITKDEDEEEIDGEEEEEEETEEGEQLELLPTSHPLAKKLKALSRKYKQAIKEEYGAKQEKIDLRHQIVEAIHKDGSIKPNEAGEIVVQLNDLKIVITPQDEKVKVTLAEEDEG